MKIDFYRTNEQSKPTPALFLFSDDYALIMNGQYIEQNGNYYQVTGQIKAGPANADAPELANHTVFVTQIPHKPTVYAQN